MGGGGGVLRTSQPALKRAGGGSGGKGVGQAGQPPSGLQSVAFKCTAHWLLRTAGGAVQGAPREAPSLWLVAFGALAALQAGGSKQQCGGIEMGVLNGCTNPLAAC